MNLPNYFLADLPPGTALTAATIGEACLTLKRNRGQFLAGRSTSDMIDILVALARQWLEQCQ